MSAQNPHDARAAAARFLSQPTHLTVPATMAKYIASAVLRSEASLVMLDLEDSIPRGDAELLERGRANVIHALGELDWGARLRFFRPRGLALDPGLTDIAYVVSRAGAKLDGLVLPKVDRPDEVRAACAALGELESAHGLVRGRIRIGVLIESVLGEEHAFAIAAASPRISSLIFGAFDYFGSLNLVGVPFRMDHPLLDGARLRIVKAAASVGVPAIAEMTTNYPTRDKTPEEQALAIEECKRDAERAKALGFRGKWTGIPAQVPVVNEVFRIPEAVIAEALAAVRAYLAAERAGRGAVMIDGKMNDRATDRIHRVVLQTALAMGLLEAGVAEELGL